MRMHSSVRAAWVSVAALLVGVALVGCGKKSVRTSFVPNQPPTVTLTAFPIDTTLTYSYVVRANWVGYDPDGKVDYFQFAILDAGASIDTITVWQRTTRNEQTFFFRSQNPDSIVLGATTLSDYHTFVIRAIDNQGAASPMVWRTFFSFTAAPGVRIFSPAPDSLLTRKLPPSVFIQWQGDDPDGEFTKKPLKYKFKLYSVIELNALGINPDRPVEFLRFAPRFAEWDSVGGDTTSRLFTDLNPDQEYVFVITCFDEAGGFDPIFTRKTNVLRFRVTLSATLGPIIVLFNDFIFYQYPSGGYARDESRIVNLEEPANTAISWNWFAIATEGALVRRTRWRLVPDTTIVELDDETPREDEATDLQHWSRWQTLGQTQDQAYHAEMGTFPGNACGAELQGYYLYIEVEDNIGLRSLGIVHSHIVRPCFTVGDSKMLIVDDRRGQPDGFRPGNPPLMNPPLGAWPTEAELDTLLFAVGGVPWKGYNPVTCIPGVTNCPTTQVNSTPGLFAGYSFDTLDTRQGLFDLTMPLSVLSKYYNVVWYTDAFSTNIPLSAGALGEQGQPPLTALVWMNSPNRPNTLSIFSRQGGRMMFFGGGVAAGTLFAWSNGRLPFPWAADGSRPILFPGRFAYDFLQLRAESRAAQGTFVNTSPRKPANLTNLTNMTLWRSSTDPLPYFRNVGQMPGFSVIEHVSAPLFLLEDRDPGPGLDEVSALDTLFTGGGAGVIPGSPCGFHYHSETNPPIHGDVIFLGFDLWSWRFQQERQNLDELMSKIWGINRGPVPQAAMATSRRR